MRLAVWATFYFKAASLYAPAPLCCRDHGRRKGAAVLAFVLFACGTGAGVRAADLFGDVKARIFLSGLEAKSISSLAVAPTGDALVGVRTWNHTGQILRLSRTKRSVSVLSTRDAVGSIAIDDRAHICYAPAFKAGVFCLDRFGLWSTVVDLSRVRITKFFRAGQSLFASTDDGALFLVRHGRARQIQIPFHIIAADGDSSRAVVLSSRSLCSIDIASLRTRNCTTLSRVLQPYPNASIAVTSRNVYVIMIPTPQVTIVRNDGVVTERQLDFRTQRIVSAHDNRVWISGATTDGRLVLRLVSAAETANAAGYDLTAGALIATGIDNSLVVVDGSAGTALFIHFGNYAGNTPTQHR